MPSSSNTNNNNKNTSNTNFKRNLLNTSKQKFYNEIKKFQQEFKPTKNIQGFSSGVVVGEKDYPNVNLIPLNNELKESSFLNDRTTIKKEYNELFKIKARNIAAQTKINIKNKSKITDDLKEIFSAKKQEEYETIFSKEIKPANLNNIVTNKLFGIIGNNNSLKEIKKGNFNSSKQIEKVVDTDMKSEEAILELHKKNISDSQIINLLTIGAFGYSFNKKIVPSRWGITAYDSIITKNLFNKIKHYPIINKNLYYVKEDKGNRFHIFLFPKKHTFESIEILYNNNRIISDYLINNKPITPNTAGGFYATRIGVLEYLEKLKKQASTIVIREIQDYEIPLGVIFVRETVREALKKAFVFNKITDLKPMLPPKVYNSLSNSNTVKNKTLFDF